MHPIAAIFENGSKFRAKILFPDNLEPLEFYRESVDRQLLFDWLHLQIPGVDVVTHQRFQMELDHIRLFGERWDFEDTSMATDEEVIDTTTAGMALPSERMSSEDILAVLNDASEQLDRMENDLDAIFPSPIVEDDDRFTF